MQRDRRASRPLFAALAVVIVLGLGFYALRFSRAHAAQAQRRAEAQAASGESTPAAAFTAPQNQPVLQPTAVAVVPLLAAVTSASPATQPSAPADPPVAPLVTSTPGLGASAVAQAEPPARPALLATDLTARPEPSVAAPIMAPTTAPVTAGNVVSDAKQKAETGDLVGAREELNTSLIAGHLSDTDADAIRHSIADINQTLVFSPERTLNDPWASSYHVQSGERMATIAGKNSVTWQLLSRINHVDPRRMRAGATIKIVKGPFFAVVTKSKFRMDLYFGAPGGPGSMYVRSFGVGLGKNDSTPTGTWQVQSGNKVLHPVYYSPDNHGVIEADDPKNPLGGYWIGLEGLDGQAVDQHSYGIHGTIDPDSIGKQASLGCIRMGHDDIELTFEMLVETKSKVVIVQ
jgi:lipoprotein-anchoring transpeptidase ErfK/SrfK